MILTQWKITMKYLLFISLILFCSCHSGSSRKGQGEKTDSIRLQKELYALHRYVDSIIKSDAILQQRFHCSGAGLTKDKVSIDFLDIPEDSFEAFKSAFKKDVFDSPLFEFNIMSDITFGPEIIPIKEDSLGQAVNIVLSPIPRDIPQGEAINPDSLSMRAEYDYYPLSTTEVKVFITNHSGYEYDCGEGYSLTYYNERQKTWEALPTNPIRNDVLWIFPSDCPTHEQTIRLYTSEVPNRPGKYRVYKSFNRNTKVAYAEFEILSEDGVERMLRIVDEYLDKYRNENDAISQNFSTWGLRGDTLDMTWSVNSSYMRKLFRQRVLNYSATVINNGKETAIKFLDKKVYMDTLNVVMRTEKTVYPVGTKIVSVILTNNNEKELSIGTDYYVVRKEKDKWVFLYGDRIWNLLEIRVPQNDSYTFQAALYPLLNNNLPGTYRIIKYMDFVDSPEKWTMAAEFRIE